MDPERPPSVLVSPCKGASALCKSVNSDIRTILRLYSGEPRKRQPCAHGKRPLKICDGRFINDSLLDIGRWYHECLACNLKEWLSRRIDIRKIVKNNDEFANLLNVRATLRRREYLAPRRQERVSRRTYNVRLLVWVQNDRPPHRTTVRRALGGGLVLASHKVILGKLGMERTDRYEIYDVGQHVWKRLRWDEYLYGGDQTCFFLRRVGVDSLPEFSDAILAV